jgi:hypothetical protein
MIGGMEQTCHRCGESVAPGSPRYSDHVQDADGAFYCADCARTKRGHVQPVMDQPNVPITMPNTNLPNTH